MTTFFKKQYLVLWVGLFIGIQAGYAQEQLVPLGGNDVIKKAYKQLPKQQKSSQFIYHESIELPFIDDFSDYTGYPDTALWIGRQAYVNQSFAVNPPTIGCVTLDAVDERGFVYAHATQTPFIFSADTLLSKPIRLDSTFVPYPRRLELRDSIYFSFYYQPGGGLGGTPWSKLGDAPETDDSLVLEFGYQTGNIALLYFLTDSQMVGDTLRPGDTLYSYCNPDLYVVVDDYHFPGEILEVPCDSVNTMEIVWTNVWSDKGRTLDKFIEEYGNTWHQVVIPITDIIYLNRGFQFRFRNYASLEGYPEELSNCDFWNIDYVRLNSSRTYSDTAINDVAFVNNPGSILKKYTAMPWEQFKDNQAAELRTDFTNYLTNLSNDIKNSLYWYQILDENDNQICFYNGGNQNINPIYLSGYQTAAVHANPQLATINFPTVSSDSLTVFVQHIFKEAGSGDANQKNDTAKYTQKFYNYYAYDDGIPESGYTITNPYSPYKKSLALGFALNKSDTLRAIDMYFNHTLNNATFLNFTLSVWADSAGKPGKELYTEEMSQEYNLELYGFQRFYLKEPLFVLGKFYIGYQIAGLNKTLNIGLDQNTNANEYWFVKTTETGGWTQSIFTGSPMMRPVLGAWFQPTAIAKHTNRSEVKVYPNPTRNQLTIENYELGMGDYTIYNIVGQIVMQGSLQSNTINVESLVNGMYFLRIGEKTVKFVKE